MSEVSTPGVNQQRVTVVAPEGISLPFISVGNYDDELAGQGPLIGLLIKQQEACSVSGTGWFQIHNLIVTTLDGRAVIDESSVDVDDEDHPVSGTTFRAYVIDPT